MAGTITAANIAVGFDVSKLKDGAAFTRGEISSISRMVQESISPVDKYNQKLEVLTRAYNQGAITAERFAQAQAMLQKKYLQAPGTESQPQGGIGGYLSGFVGVASVVASIHMLNASFTETARRIDDVSDRAAALGMTYKELIVAQRGFGEISGLTADDVTNSLQKMQINLSAAKMGTGDLARELKALNLDPSKLSSMSGVKAVKEISAEFQKIKEPADQLNFALDLFGKSGVRMVTVLRDGGKALEEMENHLQAAGVTLTDIEATRIGRMNDNLERANDYAKGLANKFALDVAGAINTVSAALDNLRDSSGSGLVDKIYNSIKEGALGKAPAEALKIMAKVDEMRAKEAADKEAMRREDLLNLDSLQKEMERSEALQKSFEQQKQTLEKQREELELGKAASIEQQALRDGMNEVMASELRQLQESLDLEQQRIAAIKQQAEEKKRIEQEAERAKVQAFEHLVKEGKELEKQSLQPLERLNQEAQRLQDAKISGAISDAAFRQGVLNAAEKMQKESNPNNVSSTAAPTLRAGSVEAYKFLQTQNEQRAKQQELIELQKRAIAIAERAAAEAKAAPRLALAR